MSQKLYDDLKSQLDTGHPKVEARISALVQTIADRIEDAHADPVRLSDLVSVLRMDPDDLGHTVATDPPERPAPPAPKEAPKEGMKTDEPPKTYSMPAPAPAKA